MESCGLARAEPRNSTPSYQLDNDVENTNIGYGDRGRGEVALLRPLGRNFVGLGAS